MLLLKECSNPTSKKVSSQSERVNLAAKSHAKIDGENIQTESSRTFNWTQKQTRHCGLEMYYFLTHWSATVMNPLGKM